MNTIANVYIQTFERNLRHLAQQSITKLRTHVQERGTNGQNHNWERLGPSNATQKTGRAVATPVANVPWSRRRSAAATYHNGELVEQEDPVQMLVDPNSNVTQNLAMSMRRQVDDIIIAAATGDATDGAGASVSFPASQQIGLTGTTSITFDLVTQVQERFMQNDIDPDFPKVFVIGPAQVRKLMQLTEQTSADYVNRQALQTLNASGIVPNWMGFTWIMSTRLLNGGTAGQTACLAFTNRALGLQVNRDITARVAEDPSVSFGWRLYCFLTMGAVRVEDEHIVWLQVLNSI